MQKLKKKMHLTLIIGGIQPVYKDPYTMVTYFEIDYDSIARKNIVEANDVNIGHDLLMNSSNNRNNILNEEFNRIRVGIILKPDKNLKTIEIFTKS